MLGVLVTRAAGALVTSFGLIAAGLAGAPAHAAGISVLDPIKTQVSPTALVSDGSRYVVWSRADPERGAASLSPVTVLDVSTGRRRVVALPAGCVQGAWHGSAAAGRLIVICRGTEQHVLMLASGELKPIGVSYAGYTNLRIGKTWALGSARCGSADCVVFENLRTGVSFTRPAGLTWDLDADPLRRLRVCGAPAVTAYQIWPWVAGDWHVSARAAQDRGLTRIVRCGHSARTLDRHVYGVQLGKGVVTWTTTCNVGDLEPPRPGCRPLVKVERLVSHKRLVWRLPISDASSDIEAVQIKDRIFVKRILSTTAAGDPEALALYRARIPK